KLVEQHRLGRRFNSAFLRVVDIVQAYADHFLRMRDRSQQPDRVEGERFAARDRRGGTLQPRLALGQQRLQAAWQLGIGAVQVDQRVASQAGGTWTGRALICDELHQTTPLQTAASKSRQAARIRRTASTIADGWTTDKDRLGRALQSSTRA